MIVELSIGTWATHNGLLKFDASQILLLDQVFPIPYAPLTLLIAKLKITNNAINFFFQVEKDH